MKNINDLDITEEQLESIVFSGATDTIIPSTAAIVLGCVDLSIAISRAKMAANFYRNGGTKTLIVTGGGDHEYNGEKISEAEYMKRYLIEDGIPEADIILENRARDTEENMIFSYPEAIWKFGANGVDNITVITSSWHLRRSILHAERFLPSYVSVHGYTEDLQTSLENYKTDRVLNLFVKGEAKWLVKHCKQVTF